MQGTFKLMKELKKIANFLINSSIREITEGEEFNQRIISVKDNKLKITYITFENENDKIELPNLILSKAKESDALIILLEIYYLETEDDIKANKIKFHPNTTTALVCIIYSQGGNLMRTLLLNEDLTEYIDKGWDDSLPDCPGYENPFEKIKQSKT